jgi:hypothetical protein
MCFLHIRKVSIFRFLKLFWYLPPSFQVGDMCFKFQECLNVDHFFLKTRGQVPQILKVSEIDHSCEKKCL